MFDAFIINRIRREQRQEQERRLPLHIEAPRMPAGQAGERGDARSGETDSRGTWVDDGWADNSWSDSSRNSEPHGGSSRGNGTDGRRLPSSIHKRQRGVVDIDFDI